MLRKSRLDIKLGGGRFWKIQNWIFFIFEEQQKKIDRAKLNESKCGISFTCSKITFYILSLQKLFVDFIDSKTWKFSLFLSIHDPPSSIFKIRNINKNLNLPNSSFRSIKMIFHHQNWCAHTRHTLEPILLGISRKNSTKFMKHLIKSLKT